MYYFSVFRVFFKIKERLTFDNLFLFYFIKEVESKFKEKVCKNVDKNCELCDFKNICIYPKLFLNEFWYKKSNYLITLAYDLDKKIDKNENVKIDFILLNEGVDSFNILYESIKESCKDVNFSCLKPFKVYNYNIFGEFLEKIDFSYPYPNYLLDEFLNLRSGVKNIKLNVYPSFLNFNGNYQLKDFLIDEFNRRLSLFLDKNVNIPSTDEINLKVLEWEKLNYQDILLKKTISKFKGYNFYKGKFILEGNIPDIWYLFDFIQTFGIGKLTTYGFGKVKIVKKF